MSEIDDLRQALHEQIQLTASLACVARGLSPFATLSPEEQAKMIDQSTHDSVKSLLKGEHKVNKNDVFQKLVAFLDSEEMPYCVSCGWNYPMHDSKCNLFPILRSIRKFA